jgi:hypothetical protein
MNKLLVAGLVRDAGTAIGWRFRPGLRRSGWPEARRAADEREKQKIAAVVDKAPAVRAALAAVPANSGQVRRIAASGRKVAA